MIGDPSGKNETRPPLNREEVLRNAGTYREQIFKVLDPDRTEIALNSSWMNRMNAEELIKEIIHFDVSGGEVEGLDVSKDGFRIASTAPLEMEVEVDGAVRAELHRFKVNEVYDYGGADTL